MKVIPKYSDADQKLLAIAVALVRIADSREHLEQMARGIWPNLDIYKGHTHWRFMPTGKSTVSFYVDMDSISNPLEEAKAINQLVNAYAARYILRFPLGDNKEPLPSLSKYTLRQLLEARDLLLAEYSGTNNAPITVDDRGIAALWAWAQHSGGTPQEPEILVNDGKKFLCMVEYEDIKGN